MKRVYVAGPISKGDQFLNVRAALEVASRLIEAGYEPFVPHLSFPLHMHKPVDYERWMRWDFAWIEVCDALLRMPGDSPGADREVVFANERGIPVFHGLDAFLERGDG